MSLCKMNIMNFQVFLAFPLPDFISYTVTVCMDPEVKLPCKLPCPRKCHYDESTTKCVPPKTTECGKPGIVSIFRSKVFSSLYSHHLFYAMKFNIEFPES